MSRATARPRGGWLALVLAALVLNGCSVLPGGRAGQPPSTYIFDLPEPAAATAEAAGAASLQIAPLTWSAEAATDAMVYVSRDYELAAFADAVWAAEPGRLIEPWVVAAFEASPAFALVAPGAASRGAQFRLDLALLRLRHEFTSTPSRVRLVLRAELSDVRSGVVFATRRIVTVAPAPSEDAYGGVRAANAALERALAKLIDFTADAVTGARSSASSAVQDLHPVVAPTIFAALPAIQYR